MAQYSGYPQDAWKQYFLNPTSSAPAAAMRYYSHRRTWINDADHVCLNLLTPSQAQAAATLIALTGGNVLSGDRLPDLDPGRVEILKKILPSSGKAARPVDLFDTDRQTVFALKIQRPFGEWMVVGVFNPSETDVAEHVLPLERLWLHPTRKYIAYDFWRERWHGQVQGILRVRVSPAGVTLLAVHEQHRGLCPAGPTLEAGQPVRGFPRRGLTGTVDTCACVRRQGWRPPAAPVGGSSNTAPPESTGRWVVSEMVHCDFSSGAIRCGRLKVDVIRDPLASRGRRGRTQSPAPCRSPARGPGP